YQNRTVAFIENGSWSPLAAKIMKSMLENSKNLTFVPTIVTIKSALSAESTEKLEQMAKELCSNYNITKSTLNNDALFNIGYGLYVITCKDGEKDNGFIGNSVTQLTANPVKIAVTINKLNYSYHIIKKTGVMNLNCISEEADMKLFENFGFVSGREMDKFKYYSFTRSKNGLAVLNSKINSFISLKVLECIDLDTHAMFICSVTQSEVVNNVDTMTYTFYQKNVKPKPTVQNGKKAYSCKICGYLYEGDVLPSDFICPLCKHPASDFEEINF
ncbi:MAG: flavin reductase, partial [Clostridia bacterium]|nr:flavin reductase [Clostridia bacterium]